MRRTVKVREIGLRPHAAIYLNRELVEVIPLAEGEEVEDLAAADRGHAPDNPPDLGTDPNILPSFHSSPVGVYRIPGRQGVAVLYGCEVQAGLKLWMEIKVGTLTNGWEERLIAQCNREYRRPRPGQQLDRPLTPEQYREVADCLRQLAADIEKEYPEG